MSTNTPNYADAQGVARLWDGAQIAQIDDTTGAVETIDYPHHEIHDGSGYFLTDTVTIGNGATREIRFATADTTKWPHFTLEVAGTAKTQLDLYETTTKAHVAGNVLTPRNRNRNSSNTSGMTVCHTPSGSGDGTLIASVLFGTDTGSGVNRVVAGGGIGSRGEIILKQNTAYLLRITSGTDGNRIATIFDWYEHTNKTLVV